MTFIAVEEHPHAQSIIDSLHRINQNIELSANDLESFIAKPLELAPYVGLDLDDGLPRGEGCGLHHDCQGYI
jgi:hypothetical protein